MVANIEKLKNQLKNLKPRSNESYIWYLLDKRILEKKIEKLEKRRER